MSNPTFLMPVYRPSPDVVSTRLDEHEAVLLSLKTQRYYSLNETGSRIWALLADGMTAGEMAEALTHEWTTEYEEARAYVQSFLAELNEEGLIEPVSDDGDESGAAHA